jgi:protein-L-isoaspartate(D-aspartate) O-methyltransferase
MIAFRHEARNQNSRATGFTFLDRGECGTYNPLFPVFSREDTPGGNLPMFTATLSRMLRMSLAIALLLMAVALPCRAQSPRQWAAARKWLVETELATAGIKSPTVLAAMREVPRHEFVPAEFRKHSYLDTTLPIGHGQTISPPYIVAWMTEQLAPEPTDRVLEIGTGSGYQAAVLSRLVKDVYTIEIHEPLAKQAEQSLQRVGYQNIHTRTGDGFRGWSEAAPFDKIIVTCSPEKVPMPLAEQLKEGGRMLIPVGESFQQNLCVLVKQGGKLRVVARTPTFFVPMTGKADSLRTTANEPLTPLANGDFEQLLESGEPAAWYYVRQAALASGGPQDAAGHFIQFSNQVPGRRSHVLQSVGIDGSRVSQLGVETWVKADAIEPADKTNPADGGKLYLSFFDADRRTVGEQTVGFWRDSFDWRRQSGVVHVPPTAIGVTVAVGLFGATGGLACDAIQVRPVQERTAAKNRQ